MGRRLFDYSAVPPGQRTLILAAMLFWSVLTIWATNRYLVQVPHISGPSMEPTLHDGERRLIWLPAFRRRDPRPGEIVAIMTPGNVPSVKRVIAGPGESIQIRDGRVQLAGQPLEEPYLDAAVFTRPGPMASHRYEVAADCFFVLGDNRTNSIDSRHFGAVPREKLIGKVL